MADESNDDKTFDPTPKRRRDAAQKGQIPRSPEVTTAFLLLAAAAAFMVLADDMARALVEGFGVTVGGFRVLPHDAASAAAYLRGFALIAFRSAAPFLLAVGGVALFISAIQGRGVITTEPLMPQWNRLDPIARAKQLWGTRAIGELVKSLIKLAIVGFAVFSVVRTALPEMTVLGQTTPFALLEFMRRYTVRTLLVAGTAYLLLALADYAFQVWQHERRLRMTREEVKREAKESEGDQVTKVRRRTIARQLARKRMLGAVADADVVVTNPTHIAVALKYDPSVSSAPVVLAMGERKVAERIKQLARENGVPTVENKPLARALFATCEVGRSIPVELFIAVAELLAFVYKTRGGRRPMGART